MANQVQPIEFLTPGFKGVNYEVSPETLTPEFAWQANNVVIDSQGRLSSRKGMDPLALNTGVDFKQVWYFENSLNSSEIFCMGDNGIYRYNSGTSSLDQLSVVLPNGTADSYTITDDDWCCVNFDNACFFFQLGHEPLIWAPKDDTNYGLMRLTQQNNFSGPQSALYTNSLLIGSHAVAAFGRLWVVGNTAYPNVVAWCDTYGSGSYLEWGEGTVTPQGGTSGQLDLTGYWPSGFDRVKAVATHNDYLIFFGDRSLVMYGGAGVGLGTGSSGVGGGNPNETMQLIDALQNTGIANKNLIANLGDELIFVSHNGLRNLGRLLQQKSLPVSELSQNVKTDFAKDTVSAYPRMIYSQEESKVLVSFPALRKVYCFDTRGILETGGFRVTEWNTSPNSATFASFANLPNGDIIIANEAGLCKYDRTADLTPAGEDAPFTMQYYSPVMNMGQVSRLKMLKHIRPLFYGEGGQNVKILWSYDKRWSEFSSLNVQLPGGVIGYYGFHPSDTGYVEDPSNEGSEFVDYIIDGDSSSGIENYIEYSGGASSADVCVRPGCSGTVIIIGVEAIMGNSPALVNIPLSIQSLNILTTLGRLV